MYCQEWRCAKHTIWTMQPLNDAWDATNWDGLCGTPWLMVALDLNLTKKVTSHKEGGGSSLARIFLKYFQRLSREDSTCCWQTSRLTVTPEVVRVVQRSHRTGEQEYHITTNVENESERLTRSL